ncbi:DUF3515 family protein [Nocardia vinacea]|uniref:DUF3515 domain-containing protein n=1 Tax=Nocardia vinacea TaxID=96468 RepID=UPI0034032ABD
MAAESSDRDSSEAESSKAELSKGTVDPAADSAAAEPTPTVDRTGAEIPSPAADAERANPATASTGATDAEPTAADADEPAAEGAAGTASDSAEPATASTSTNDTEPAAADRTESADEPATEPSGYPPALIATAVALPVVLVVAVLVAAVLARRAPTEREPLVLGPVPAPAADGPACTALLPALPVDLGDYSKSTLVEPASPATRAWQRKDGGNAIVLRCGLERPLEFNRASPLQIVNGVQWFEVRDAAAKASTWFAVDRATYIALTIPDGSGPTPLQGVSDTITANIPAQPIDPGPLPN